MMPDFIPEGPVIAVAVSEEQESLPAEDVRLVDHLQMVRKVFSVTNPRDAISGTVDFVKNVLTGLGVGAASLIMCPIMAFSKGWKSFLAGLGTGVAGLVLLPISGLCIGINQMAKGCLNTPGAIRHAVRGDFYDSIYCRWTNVALGDALCCLPATDDDVRAEARAHFKETSENEEQQSCPTEADACSGSSSATQPAGLDYYALLGVEKSASAADIRKLYLRKAVVMHPDKNPGDLETTKKFQELTTAYNTLSNESSRHQYDTYGAAGMNDGKAAGAAGGTPLADILKCQWLYPFVGDLRLFRFFENGVSYTDDMARELRHRRRLRICKSLLAFAEGSDTLVREACMEALASRIGRGVLQCVAAAYAAAAREHLCRIPISLSSDFKGIGFVLDIVKWSTIAAVNAKRNCVSQEEAVNAVSAFAVLDVWETVREACRYYLADEDVSAEQRRHRAERLRELSDIISDAIKQ